MAKTKTLYVCDECGFQSASWSGKCFGCGAWNSLVEQIMERSPASGKSAAAASVSALKPANLKKAIDEDAPRLRVPMSDVSDVLGGGIVKGSVTLLAGQPGIGKSTLLLQLADAIAKHHRVLYVSGEESEHQVALRAKRLGLAGSKIALVSSSSADAIVGSIAEGGYDLVIVDSIQTVACEAVASSSGSVAQITNSTKLLSSAAKRQDTALLLVGHVTKEGSIAGPKLLEHIVDVVLQIEGDRYGGFKMLRAIKNRYGSTEHSAIFEMKDTGLELVKNPSAALLAERQVSDGSVVLATMEGTRAMLVEVQALVNRTNYGYPKRAASGLDLNRLNVLIAMLERRTKLSLGDMDVYVNIVGGLKLKEQAADLAVCMAIASASKGMQLKQDAVVFGEVGLSGEVRHVPHVEKRLQEARKLGLDTAIGPKAKLSTKDQKFYTPVRDVRSALNHFLSK